MCVQVPGAPLLASPAASPRGLTQACARLCCCSLRLCWLPGQTAPAASRWQHPRAQHSLWKQKKTHEESLFSARGRVTKSKAQRGQLISLSLADLGRRSPRTGSHRAIGESNLSQHWRHHSLPTLPAHPQGLGLAGVASWGHTRVLSKRELSAKKGASSSKGSLCSYQPLPTSHTVQMTSTMDSTGRSTPTKVTHCLSSPETALV